MATVIKIIGERALSKEVAYRRYRQSVQELIDYGWEKVSDEIYYVKRDQHLVFQMYKKIDEESLNLSSIRKLISAPYFLGVLKAYFNTSLNYIVPEIGQAFKREDFSKSNFRIFFKTNEVILKSGKFINSTYVFLSIDEFRKLLKELEDSYV